jgi:integrase
MEQSTLLRQHETACRLGKVAPFLLYTFRHTCITRWARILDRYTPAYLAGQSDFATTRRYVHPNLNTAREAREIAQNAQCGHKTGHSPERTSATETAAFRAIA